MESKLKILTNQNLNLHSASTPGGLIHVHARIPAIVPDDVMDHPLFARIVKKGIVTILQGSVPKSLTEGIEPVKNSPDLPPSTIPVAPPIEDEDEDDEDEDDEDEDEDKKPGTKPVPKKK